jgi:hypothetical protein
MIDRQGQPRELYNLASDPLEFFDKLDSEPRMVEEMMVVFQELDLFRGVD